MHQFIKISGTPYERGFQYGSQAKEKKFLRLLKNIKFFSKKKLPSVGTRLLSSPNRFGKK